MAVVTSSTVLTGATIDATAVTIPLAALGLTQAMAGDAAVLKKALDDTYFKKISALASTAQPTNFSITKATPTVLTTGGLRQQYTSNYNLAPIDTGSAPLAPES